MQDGSANKNSGWQQKLDNLQPASFDKEAAWNKLQQRLEAKERKRGFLWMRSAAVVLFLLAGFYFLWPTKTKPTGENMVKKTDNPQQAPFILLKNNTASVFTSGKTDAANQNSVEEIKTNAEKKTTVPVTLAIPNPDHPAPETAAVSKEENRPEAVQPVPNKTETAIPIATLAQASPKPKLKVVHNNELISTPVVPAEPANNTQAQAARPVVPGFRKPILSLEESGPEQIQPVPRKRILSFGSVIAGKEN